MTLPPTAWPGRLWKSFTSNFGLKLMLGLFLPPILGLGYALPQHLIFVEPRQVEPTWIDQLVPFDVAWTPVYLMFYIITILLPGFISSRTELLRFCRGALVMFAIAIMIFFIHPILGPRPTSPPTDGLYGLITRLDKNLNTLPSLHVAAIHYCLLWMGRLILAAGVGRWWLAIMVFMHVWAGLIYYSTMATKQHHFADIPTGLLLGWLAYRLVPPRPMQACEKTGHSRADGRIEPHDMEKSLDV